jgi:hypothetical protein
MSNPNQNNPRKTRISVFIVKYFLTPLLVIFGIIFFFLVSVNFVNNQPLDYLQSAFYGLVLSFAFALLILWVPLSGKLMLALTSSTEKIIHSRMPGVEIKLQTAIFSLLSKMPFNVRYELKNYFLYCGIGIFVTGLTVFGSSLATHLSPAQTMPPQEFVVSIILFMTSMVLFTAYLNSFGKIEKVKYFLNEAIVDIDHYLDAGKKRPEVAPLQTALYSYQKLMFTCSIRNLRKILMTTKLVLERGTKAQILSIRDYEKAFLQAIENQDEALFDTNLGYLVGFLDKFQTESKGMLQINEFSKMEQISSKIISKYITPSVQQAIVQLFVFVAGLLIVWLIFSQTGINLTQLNNNATTGP